jgi:hypothetical protein
MVPSTGTNGGGLGARLPKLYVPFNFRESEPAVERERGGIIGLNVEVSGSAATLAESI